jgi:hypothetical protein
MTSSFSFTSRLLNYVEPYFIDGVAKTAFYTEVNTNIKKNDKVFISNGHYDSERYISKGKWVKNADGYRVLYADRCKIVLDINYNEGYYAGLTQTYIEENFDNYIKVYHIRSQREFDYINKLFIDSYTQSRVSKFEKNLTNNIIYSEQIYSGSLSGIGANNGLGSTKAFWARQGINWINVSNQFSNNSFTFSQSYYDTGLTQNGRMVIVGEDIDYGGKIFKEKNIYKHSGSVNDWKIDTEYKQPFISKLNFKQGIFRGIHNDGIFGSYRKMENWYGSQSTWNSGFFVNSNWNSGVMNSKSVQNESSYYCILENGFPVQTTDFSNNRGNGYNYVLDSNIYSGIIENGNFINCNIGTNGYGLTAIDDYFGGNNVYNISLEGGLYNYCDINNTKIKDSFTLDSIVVNSYLRDVKTLNTQLSESYSEGGELSINNGISVLSADLSSYIPNNFSLTQNNIRGILKLYISDKDYERLDTFDNFFITKINKEYILSSLNSDQKILLPYETRYVLDTFWDFKVGGNNQECIGSLKTKNDNLNIPIVKFLSGSYYNNLNSNPNVYASIDIDLGQFLAFYENDPNLVDTKYTYLNQSIIKRDNVQNLFLNTSISNSDFRNGVIEGINWISGSNVNYPSNIIKYENNKLKITKIGSDEILIYLNENKPTINDNQLRIGTYVWLDSIFYTDDNGNITDISGAYKIRNYSSDQITISNNLIVGLVQSPNGTYSVLNTMPNYVSIHKLLIENSNVNSGLFNRTLFKNSTFYNETFINNDRLLSNSNIDKLRIIGQIFKSSINTINSGLVHKSHIMDVIWNNGISNNNIWINATFSNGVFNNGYWIDGIFNSGVFQNSKDTNLSSPDFTFLQYYKNWFNGTFNDGEFYNSVWLNGVFNGGKFYNSDWYGGIWNNGILGDKNLPTLNTSMSRYLNLGVGATQTYWYNGIVENAQIGGDGIVYWYNGKFNNGVFTSDGTDYSKESIWFNGDFNGGNFTNLARWKDGNFNKGKFTSYYGWTNSGSTYSSDYSWEYGQFNGGQFGNGEYATNSTWFNGEFNDGIFQGRVWNDGIFQNGRFNGGASYSAISQEESFVDSFTNSYYGLWRNGWVTNIKHKALLNREMQSVNLRINQEESQKSVTINDVLWVNGIFDHPNGEMNNSSWLSGKFKNGTFKNSTFNPYVRRDWWASSFGTYSSFNLSLLDCVWEGGDFEGGNFYISDWYTGKFISGSMSGSRWINGIWNFGSAKNIYWENGIWKNGLWDGSPFDYNYLDTNNNMIPGKDRDILLRVSNVHRNGKIHIINAFTGSNTTEVLLDGNFSNINKFYGWTFSNTGLTQWISAPNGITLPSSSTSNPSIYLASSNYDLYFTELTFTVGGSVSAGDEYRVYIGDGYISVVADAFDDANSIAFKLSNRINEGTFNNIVIQEFYFPSYYIQWVTWSSVIYDPFLYGVSSTSNLSDVTIYIPSGNSSYSNAIPTGYITGTYSESEIVYALSTDTTMAVFTQSGVVYNITLNVSSTGGRTDFVVSTGNNQYPETISGDLSKTLSYEYTSNGFDDWFSIKRVMYPNPDSNSTFTITGASVKIVEGFYDGDLNNKLYQFATFSSPFIYGLTGTTVSLPTSLIKNIVSNGEIVSLKFGNGAFKYGIWEGGYWNNGWRSIWNNNEVDYIIFEDIYDNYFIQSSQNLWKIKLKAFTTIGDLQVGDKVAIGNIVCIDVNENRNLIKDFFRVVEIGVDYIVVEVSLNLPVRRIIKDSDDHMIYVSKNIWLSGVFHNGYFKGIWNYGKFKGYPYITKMEDSHWVDGIFDGGHFKSDKEYYQLGGQTYSYNSGLVQNFIFRDNNVAINKNFLYNSWIDANYFTYSMINLFKDNRVYDSRYNVIMSDNNLRGYPVVDVLSSESLFRNSYDLNSKSYKLGTKYKIYNDFIGDSSYFTYPLNNKGLPGVDEFIANGWTYSDLTYYTSNTDASNQNQLKVDYKIATLTNQGVKFVATQSMYYHNSNTNISMNNEPVDTAGYTLRVSNLGLPYTSGPIVSNPMSSHSYTKEQWEARFPTSIQALSFNYANTLGLPLTFGDTTLSNRRAYVINSNYFNFGSTSSNYDGYVNIGTFSYSDVIETLTDTVGSFNYTAFKAPRTSNLIVKTNVPFTFYADESYNGGLFSGDTKRGGWSIFRFIGVLEVCRNTGVPTNDTDWKYLAHTTLRLTNPNSSSYNGYSYDLNTCAIAFDGRPSTFYGQLEMNTTVSVNAGDRLRFRLYFISLQKMWASIGSGTSRAPGNMQFAVGVGNTRNTIGYFDNNEGFLEIYDPITYTDTTNILNNKFSKEIEKFRYSIIDFDLDDYVGLKYQGTQSRSNLPTIFLLNEPPDNAPNGFDVIINHADTGVPGNKKEYFYNRDSLQMLFTSLSDFTANFGKISFLESDMIPFFVYATESNINNAIQVPLSGTGSTIVGTFKLD